MTTCVDNVCGLGGFNNPKPGDPDNNSVLTATPAYGGIDLNWSFPSTNPWAVAHTRVYRAISNDVMSSQLIKVIGGNFYYDPVPPNVLYYYWIEFVSVNGTYGSLIGPASSTAMSTIEKTIEDLTGRIDAGVLAQSLKGEINKIVLLDSTITDEIQNRLDDQAALGNLITLSDGTLVNALTILETETQARITSEGAIVNSMNLMAAGFEDSLAGVVEEVNILVGPDSALAEKVLTTEAEVFGNVTTGQVGLSSKVITLDGKVVSIGSLYTVKLNTNGLIGGFGTYNDGTTVQAGFDVDSFWVGRTSANMRKPFIIDSGVVYIDEAAINKLTFSKLRDESGSFIVANGKVKANYLDTNGLIIRDANGVPIFGSGTPLTLDFITGLGSFATRNSLGFTDLIGSKPAIDATNGAPAGTFVNGVAVATLTSNAANGLSAFTGTVKYRTGGAPTNAPVATGITITNNTNGTCNIRLDWAAYTQGTNQADFIILAWTKDSSAPGLADSTILFNVTSGASYYVFEGVNPADTYSFGIAAGRRTELGLEITSLHTPTTAPDWRGVTGGTPNFTANIDGVSAAVLKAGIENFNNRNDRNAAGISLPSVAGNGTAVDHIANTDGSVDLSFEWGWSGNNADIDGWIIYVHSAASSTSFYSFGTSVATETLYYTAPEKRAFLLLGVAANKYYTFGIEAYRVVDKDINASGIIRSGVITGSLSGENPYQPSSTVAFAGDITGTINSINASTVISNASNGNVAFAGTDKFRTAAAPSNVPVIGTITQSQTSDGNIVVEVPYTYSQGTLPADKLYVYYREGGGTVTSADTAMATNPVSGSMEFTLKPQTTYSFGVQAVRTVDSGPIGTTITSSANITTTEALFNGSVAGKAASLIVSAVNNFNTANDRNATAVLAPTLNNSGNCVDHTLQTDGSANISFEWNWSGTEGDIDGFQVFVFQSSTFSSSYNFGTDDNAETVYEVPAVKRAFIIYGTPANNYYTFGVRAYRKVDKDIAPAGIIASTLVKATYTDENPYRPSASVAFVGNVTGTVNNIPANQVNVWSSISGTGKPVDGADVTANNTAADFVGRGVLARQDAVFLGSTVKFANGDVIGLGDLVTRLSKIGSGNISTFVDGLAITDAYIGNAAIKTAKIDDLAVNTLKIGTNAVTIPNAQSWPGTTEGTGANITVATLAITLDYPGTVYVACGGYISYGSGWRTVTTSLYINGTGVASGGGAEGWTNAALSGALEDQPAGTYTATLVFNGAAGSRIHNPSLYIVGTKK